MKPFKWWEKILVILLTLLFLPSFFFTTIFSLKKFDEDPRFFLIGMGLFAVNIAIFFGLMKIFSKYYDYRSRLGVKLFFYAIFIFPLPLTLAFLASNNAWPHMVVYLLYFLAYRYVIEQHFGRLDIKIDKTTDKLLVSNLGSFNSDIRVIGKNKKVKSSTEEIKVGDIIRIERDGEAILMLDVIKNDKKK